MAHGIPSSYKEFRDWLLANYPNAIQFRDTTISIDEYAQLPLDEVAAETLVYAMDHASGEKWCDFEDALARIHFFHKLPPPLPEEAEERDPDHNQRMGDYLLRLSTLSNAIILAAQEFWPSFFSKWINTVEKKIEQGLFAPHQRLVDLFSDPSNVYMTFNYTKTLQQVYGIRTVKHIHNRVGQTLIFGHGDDRAEYHEFSGRDTRPNFSSSDLNDFIQSLRKDTGKQLRKYSDFFRKLNTSIDRVYSYGFSFSTVDNPYIKEVIKRISHEATWYFTTYETNNKEELRIKKIRLRRYGFSGLFKTFAG